MIRRAALAVLFWLSAAGLAFGQSGWVQPTFDDLINEAPGRSRIAQGLYSECLVSHHPVDGGLFFGRSIACKDTVGAVLDTLDIAATLTPVRVYCPGRQLHWTEAADVFVAWAAANPTALRVPGAVAVVQALRHAFPCKNGGA